MRIYTDEELVAYADGELPASRADEIARAARADTGVADRIKAFQDSRRMLREAFAGKLNDPVPQRLRGLLDQTKVLTFPRQRESRVRWQTWLPMAAAALVVLGVGLNASRWLGPRQAADTAVAFADANLLNQALETSASGVPVALKDKEVLPLSTLRTGQGQWCREFESRAGTGASLQKSRGIACRNDAGNWDLRVITTAPQGVSSPQNGYQTASGSGPDLANTLGKPQALTPAQEQERIQNHWN